jgi:hypothetical protein
MEFLDSRVLIISRYFSVGACLSNDTNRASNPGSQIVVKLKNISTLGVAGSFVAVLR